MYRLSLLFSFVLLWSNLSAQNISLVAPLQSTVWETSGLILLNQRLITHNDSGDGPILYELDTITGVITRQVLLQNANHRDWEDIIHDGTYIYVGDFGNNNGSRTDLRIYRLSINDYLTTTTNSVTVDTIEFNYSDQTDFTPSQFSTNFDAEGLISFGDSLYIFTKNWGNLRTNIYPVPKIPGNYSLTKIDSIDTQGLVTGATYDQATNTIMLCGYTATPFFTELSNFTGNQFSSGVIDRMDFSPVSGYSTQVEAITYKGQDQYYFSSEYNQNGGSGLFIWDNKTMNSTSLEISAPIVVFPNPASDYIEVDSPGFIELRIYGVNGSFQLSSNQQQVDVSMLEPGVYFILMETTKGFLSQKLVLER